MGGRRHEQARTEELEQPRPERGREAGIAVKDDLLRETVVAEYQVQEQLRRVISGHFSCDRSKVHHLAEAIAGAALVVPWETKYEVHANGSPRARGDGKRTEWRLLRRRWLHSLTDLAGPNPFPDPLVHTMPGEVAGQGSERLLVSELTTCRSVVVFMNQTSTKVVIRGDDDARRIVRVYGVRQEVGVELLMSDRVTRWARQLRQRLRRWLTKMADDPSVDVIVVVRVSDLLTQWQNWTRHCRIDAQRDTRGTVIVVGFVRKLLMTRLATRVVSRASGERVGKNVVLAWLIVHDEVYSAKNESHRAMR
jgi:hypothetical protein